MFEYYGYLYSYCDIWSEDGADLIFVCVRNYVITNNYGHMNVIYQAICKKTFIYLCNIYVFVFVKRNWNSISYVDVLFV